MLKVRELTKCYPIRKGLLRRPVGALTAVDGVSFTLGKGETLGIVGESGCGKSTLGRCLLRLEEPTTGSITMEGENILALTPSALRRWRKAAQMVFQDPFASLNPRKTIGENIGGAFRFHNIPQTRIAATLERVGLSPDIASRYPHEFSGGQQQRICIARAIALEPELLVCDEVVSALDVSIQAQILNLLADLKKELNMSYLFISHDLGVVRYLCDRVLVLYLGKVCEEGPTEEVFSNPKHPYTQMLLSAIPKAHPSHTPTRLPLIGEPPSPRNPPSGCPFHPRCPQAQPNCASAPPPHQQAGEHHWRCIHSKST
ncbi:MAG: ABC transporter ATP-binding protein [Parachlamydiales bacterium]